ncbi:D-alanyl-D-alanine carboxypeptidase [Notoacmeibacter sp. MSK16QG-6]|uniref:D-alanyl-D-alanine carboxypeptidase n=1 Tax=Notoacmeibacter sp. MSK16QG-6 TaxID=2957982 RepID=UPI00209D5C44|nr:D-alanyl-D-alanine carboxypeptidase [Notoacmeibacter sp. MSK16QG-6]MCP1199314.1 D-alanyl-D-alanine carboxypeptidase [Notoacmeibacter sp. MSK16QG-6]
MRFTSPTRPRFQRLTILSGTLSALLLGGTVAAGAAEYAGIVMDAKTGQTLYSHQADSLRYPASLTKMMTLYITFEAMKAGKIGKNTQIPMSAHCSRRPPTKIGIRPGGSIRVEPAILSLVTKSANDVSCALGEYFAGSEARFGKVMTAKARGLGMSKTVFRNPHGLPDSKQVTTARDMARLGIALREHFPEYYDYFATRSFSYGKARYGNHNKLLGHVRGVDGIKTGYTRASGFNLVSSVKADGRSIVAVVMGGRTGASRNAQMKKLIAGYLSKASRQGSGNLIARAAPAGVQYGMTIASIDPSDLPLPMRNPAFRQPEAITRSNAVVAVAAAPQLPPAPVSAYAPVAPRPQQIVASHTPPEPVARIDTIKTSSTVPGAGQWVVQVASVGSPQQANSMIASMQQKASSLLAKRQGFTVPFVKDGTEYHRVRFAGFDGKSDAWSVCKGLKRQKIACYAVQQ